MLLNIVQARRMTCHAVMFLLRFMLGHTAYSVAYTIIGTFFIVLHISPVKQSFSVGLTLTELGIQTVGDVYASRGCAIHCLLSFL
jgi:hypothetical protein